VKPSRIQILVSSQPGHELAVFSPFIEHFPTSRMSAALGPVRKISFQAGGAASGLSAKGTANACNSMH